MTAKEYLQSVYTIQKRIDRLQNTRQEIRGDLYSIGSPSGQLGSDRVQTSKNDDRMLKLIAKVDELEREIVEEIDQLTQEKTKITREIEAVPNENYKQLLYERYVLCKKWERIAIDHDRCVRWIFQMHGNALKAFEKSKNTH